MTKIKTILSLIILTASFTIFANEGKEIYDRYCTVCHSPSMASMFGSPAAHNMQAWAERKETAWTKVVEDNSSVKNLQTSEKEVIILNVLVQSAINGTDKGMPPMGTCMDCTEDQLQLAIKFMSSSE